MVGAVLQIFWAVSVIAFRASFVSASAAENSPLARTPKENSSTRKPYVLLNPTSVAGSGARHFATKTSHPQGTITRHRLELRHRDQRQADQWIIPEPLISQSRQG